MLTPPVMALITSLRHLGAVARGMGASSQTGCEVRNLASSLTSPENVELVSSPFWAVVVEFNTGKDAGCKPKTKLSERGTAGGGGIQEGCNVSTFGAEAWADFTLGVFFRAASEWALPGRVNKVAS